MADRDDPEREPAPEPPKKMTLLDGLQLVFLIAACSGVFFSIRGPAANEAQALFRLGVMVGGLFGLAVVTILKYVMYGRL